MIVFLITHSFDFLLAQLSNKDGCSIQWIEQQIQDGWKNPLAK